MYIHTAEQCTIYLHSPHWSLPLRIEHIKRCPSQALPLPSWTSHGRFPCSKVSMCLWAFGTAQCAAGLRTTGSGGALLSRLELHRGPVASGVPKWGRQQGLKGGRQTWRKRSKQPPLKLGWFGMLAWCAFIAVETKPLEFQRFTVEML